jgi:integrase/recombinase XerD
MTVLRQRMTEDMQVRNLSPHTQASYLQQVSLFARYFRTSPDALTPEHIRTYQIYLTNKKKLATSSIHMAVAALRFLYRVTLKKEWTFGEDIPLPKKPQKLPVVLSPEEVVHFLGCVDCDKHRVILTTCYAAGLRISEAVRLTAAAIDSARIVIRVVQGKGSKDRYVMLSPMLLEILRNYWKAARPKQWLFPGIHNERPITKNAVEAACQKAHRLSGLSKPVTPHSLRHYLPHRTMSSNFRLCPVLRRKPPVGRDIVRPPHRARSGRDVQRHRFDWSCHGCVSNSGAAKRVRLKGEAHMSGCALFSATIKDSDRCWICSVASGDGTEGSLEILPRPAITRGTCRFA